MKFETFCRRAWWFLGAVVCLVFLSDRFPVGHVFMMLVTTLALSAGLHTPVTWLKKVYIPRSLGILLIYAAFFTLVSVASVKAVPLVTSLANVVTYELPRNWGSIQELLNNVLPPPYAEQASHMLKSKVPELASQMTAFARTLSSVIGTLLSWSFDTMLILVMSFFLTKEEGLLSQFASRFAHRKQLVAFNAVLDRIMTELGLWACAQLLLAVFFGVTFSGLLLIAGTPYAVSIGLVAIVLEAVLPFIGGVVALVLALIVVVIHMPVWGLPLVVGSYLIVESVQVHYVGPKLMDKYLHFHSLISLVAVWLGFIVMGVMGSLLTLPIVVMGRALLDYFDPAEPDPPPTAAP